MAMVLGSVCNWLPLVLLDIVNVTIVDISLKDVEFSKTVLSAVEGNCEMETWIRQLSMK